MDMKGRLENLLELKSSADDMYHVFRKNPHHVPDHTPTNIQGVDLHDGESLEADGAIKIWKYTIDGKKEDFKERMEFDEASKTVTLVGLGGHLFELYKVYNVVFQFIPKQQGCLAKCLLDYEKQNPDVPVPNNYQAVNVGIVKDIDAKLSQA